MQSQLLVQVLVRKAFLSLSLLLELRTQPLAHPIAGVAVDVPVGFAHRPAAEVVGPAAKFAVDSTRLCLANLKWATCVIWVMEK